MRETYETIARMVRTNRFSRLVGTLTLILLVACGGGASADRESRQVPTATPIPTVAPITSGSATKPSTPSANGVVTCRAAPTGECFWQAYQQCDLAHQAIVTVDNPATTDPGRNITTSQDIFTIVLNGTTCAIRDEISVDVLQPSGVHGGAAAIRRCTGVSYDGSNHLLHFQGCDNGDSDVIVP